MKITERVRQTVVQSYFNKKYAAQWQAMNKKFYEEAIRLMDKRYENLNVKERYINFQGKISSFDMSDGKGYMPFSMTGAGNFKVKIDGEEYSSCTVYGIPDKETPYKLVRFVWNFTDWNIFMPKDKPFDINDYHYEYWEDPKNFQVIE